MQNLQGLYVIADAACIGTNNIVNSTEEVLSAGVKIIQYRDKINKQSDRYNIAQALRKLTHDYDSLLIINDDVKLTKTIDADGVHLGKDDVSIVDARMQLGKDKIIGASCYAKFENALQAINSSANYIAFGSFFSSTTKPHAPKANLDLIIKAKQQYKISMCAIGGITPENASPLLAAGVDMLAVISAIFSSENPKRVTQNYLALIKQYN